MKALFDSLILMGLAHLTIDRVIGVMIVSGPSVLQCHLSRLYPACFILFAMLFWPKYYFYAFPGNIWEKRLKMFIILILLIFFEFFTAGWLCKYMWAFFAYLIVFVIENIFSFPMFVVFRVPGYEFLLRPSIF